MQELQISLGASEFRDMAMEIVIPRSSGILEGTRNQSMGSHQVRIELPQNWYENNDLLGFALCCVYVWVPDEFNPRCEPLSCLDCKLAISGNCQSKDVDKFQIESECHCSDDDDDHGSASDLVWVIYYPKDAIKKQYLSNQWTHFTASFGSATLEAKECGIHPIYGCFKCRRDKECQQKLCLKGSAINELPLIESPFELGSLCLRECKNLESLPSTICQAQCCCDDTHSTEHNHSPMDTITHNVDDNVVDAQDEEEDHMHKWLDLLCKSVQWICCRRC